MIKRVGVTNVIVTGLIAILLGYLTVWLPGPGVGLTLIGLELNEWIKFLPEVQSGQISPRHWIGVSPMSLGMVMALLTIGWSNGRWQTWIWRGMGILASLLALPPAEVILQEGWREWLFLVGGVGVVALIAFLSGWEGLWRKMPAFTPYVLIPIIALLGILLPSYIFFQVRPVVSYLLGVPIGIGLGWWLNCAGHLLVGIGSWHLYFSKNDQSKR